MTAMLAAQISTRDMRLVTMLARGHTTDRTAHELRLSRHTVSEVISILLDRFNCQNRAELVAYCYAHQLLPTGVWPPPYPSGNTEAAGRRPVSQPHLCRCPMYDPITALREAGLPVDQLSESQREVLASLTEQETSVIISVQQRLRETEGEVVAHDLKLL